MELIDSYGRHINYLRLSVTDRCNLRCRYCMPSNGIPKLKPYEILSYEDLSRIAREAVSLGMEKIRITGGEPLVRKGLVGFLEDLSSIPGLKELVLTTNGLLLGQMAAALRRAGVQRLNVSLDSLRPASFAAITRGGDLGTVLAGIAAAEAAGFPPVKLNAVVMRGVNDDEVLDFAALTLGTAHTVRFIEYMPTGSEDGWRSLYVSGNEILQRITSRYTLLPLESIPRAGPARNFRICGAAGVIGIITPMSHHFCGDCNRIRVSASGWARGCLLASEGIDLKPYLRSGDNNDLRAVLRRMVLAKPDGHRLAHEMGQRPFSMSQIGG